MSAALLTLSVTGGKVTVLLYEPVKINDSRVGHQPRAMMTFEVILSAAWLIKSGWSSSAYSSSAVCLWAYPQTLQKQYYTWMINWPVMLYSHITSYLKLWIHFQRDGQPSDLLNSMSFLFCFQCELFCALNSRSVSAEFIPYICLIEPLSSRPLSFSWFIIKAESFHSGGDGKLSPTLPHRRLVEVTEDLSCSRCQRSHSGNLCCYQDNSPSVTPSPHS